MEEEQSRSVVNLLNNKDTTRTQTMNNIDTNEVEPLLRSSAKGEKRETSRAVKLAALAGCGILAGAAVFGTGDRRDSFRLFGGKPAVRLGAQTGESAGQLIDGVNEEHLWVKEKSVIIPGTCNSPADVKLVGFQPKGKNIWEPTLEHEILTPYKKESTETKNSYIAAFVENNYWRVKMVRIEIEKTGDTECTMTAVQARNALNTPYNAPSGYSGTNKEYRSTHLDDATHDDVISYWENYKNEYEVATKSGGKYDDTYANADYAASFGIESLIIEPLPNTPLTPEYTITLHTACSPLGQLPFKFNGTGSIGASVITKSMSNEFYYDKAMSMKETSCGTYQATLPLAYGEEFGFYLHPATVNLADENTIADIGCSKEGDGKCPARESPAPLSETACTKEFHFGDLETGNTFYNRVFDEVTLIYNWGGCETTCGHVEPEGCSSSTLAHLTDDNFHDSVAECLAEAPVDGECTNFGSSSKFGTMPNWDVSKVTNMADTFYAKGKFNADISRWDTSSVTSMQQMFFGNYPSVWIDDFNQDISNWDVSKVTNMNRMFAFCRVFNQDMNKWDVSSVTDMGAMFHNANAFNMPLDDWDTSKVQTMVSMFHNARSWAQSTACWDTKGLNYQGASRMHCGLGTQWNSQKAFQNAGLSCSSTSLNQYCNWNDFDPATCGTCSKAA